MNTTLSAELIVSGEYLSDRPVNIQVRLTNQSSENIFLLKAATPFEGLFSDCFEVNDTIDQMPIYYDGFLVKRGPPPLESFLFLGPGAKVETTVDLGSAYAVAAPGLYTVALHVTVSYSVGSLDGGILADFSRHQSKLGKQTLSTPSCPFKVLPGQFKRMTVGEQNRDPRAQAARLAPGGGVKALDVPTPPNVVGADPTQTTQILQAHQNAYNLVVAALNNLGPVGGPATTDPTYALWFGAYTDARFNIVSAVYGQVQTNFQGPAITYSTAGSNCLPNSLGYTSYGSTTIYLCSLFWSAPATGTDSQAGTLVHEHTHSDANTSDIAYGQSDCQALAASNPDQAVNNADSYEYYAGG